MSTYQMVLNSTAAVRGVSISRLYQRFLNWWVSLYAAPPRKLPPML
jgi:hypothetical protein